MSTTKKTAKKAVKKVTRKPSLAERIIVALGKKGVSADVSRVPQTDSYVFTAVSPYIMGESTNLRRVVAVVVTGREIDAARDGAFTMVKARILKALS